MNVRMYIYLSNYKIKEDKVRRKIPPHNAMIRAIDAKCVMEV